MTYAVVWSDNGSPVYAGALELTRHGVVLEGTAPQAGRERMELPYADLAEASIEPRPGARLDGRPTLVLATRRRQRLRIASVEGKGALRELAERLETLRAAFATN